MKFEAAVMWKLVIGYIFIIRTTQVKGNIAEHNLNRK